MVEFVRRIAERHIANEAARRCLYIGGMALLFYGIYVNPRLTALIILFVWAWVTDQRVSALEKGERSIWSDAEDP